MSVETNKLIVKKFHDAMAMEDGNGALECLSPDAVWWMPSDAPGGMTMTKDQMAVIFNTFSALYKQAPKLELLGLTAEDDRVVLEKTARDGLTPGGAKYSNEYLMLFRLADGLIVEIREYYDPRKVEPLYAEMQALQANSPG